MRIGSRPVNASDAAIFRPLAPDQTPGSATSSSSPAVYERQTVKPQSESISELAPAFVAAQAELRDVVATESAGVGKYMYKYCDLAGVRESVVPVLARHGLAVVQTVVPRREPAFAERFCVLGSLRTQLVHASGQWIAGEHPIAGDWSDPQKIGSAITYARRYGLAAICGVAQVDDDGASGRPSGERYNAPVATASASASNGSAPPWERRGRDLPPARQPGDDYEDLGEFDEFESDPPPAARAERNGVSSSGREPRGLELPSDPPRTGKSLYGWIKEHNQWPFFNDQIKRANGKLPARISEWSNDMVAWAWPRYVASVKAPALNGNGRR
jgi:hypothetical protein